MSLWEDAKKKVQQFMKPRQDEGGDQLVSNRADGGFSGYVPKMKPPAEQMVNPQAEQDSMEYMMPAGVDRTAFQRMQNAGGQTGAMPQQGMPQQRFNTSYQQPVQQMPPVQSPQGFGAAQPFAGNTSRQQGPFQQPQHRPPMQQAQPFQQQYQQPTPPPMQQAQPMNQAQPVQQMPQQPQYQAPVQQNGNTVYFPGAFEADGNAYKVVCRVAQITGVPSCFRVIEFMYNNEAVIVNAELVTDLVEADRCMDLIFGAACAMKQRLIRVSGKQIYLITPPQVYVAPFDNIRRAGLEDIDRRWPGALQMNMQSQAPQGGYAAQPRPDDFAGGFGRHASRPAQDVFANYGGFGAHTR